MAAASKSAWRSKAKDNRNRKRKLENINNQNINGGENNQRNEKRNGKWRRNNGG
jgi:hypothetical protein